MNIGSDEEANERVKRTPKRIIDRKGRLEERERDCGWKSANWNKAGR